MTHEKTRSGSLDGFAVSLFWGSVLAGLLLPALSMWLGTRRSAPDVFSDHWFSLNGAEPGLVFMAALHAAPFMAFGVFCLLHLGKAPAAGGSRAARRLGGALAAALLMVVVSLWGNIAIFASRSSTGAIGFIFLPFYVLLASVVGYGMGRLIVRLVRRW